MSKGSWTTDLQDVNSPILQRKRTLLEFEGVGFDGDRVVKSAVMGPEDF